MPKPIPKNGERNLIRKRLTQLRLERGLSQRDLAREMQLAGYDMDKNVINRIETNQRYVSDIEIKAFCDLFQVSYRYLLDGEE